MDILKGKRTRPIIAAVGFMVMASFAPDSAVAFTAAQRAACGGDAQRLCGQYLANMQQLSACMNRNSSRVSAGCKTAMGMGTKKKKGR